MKYGRLRADAVVEFNRFERADGDGEVISNKSSGNIMRGNTFIGCGGALWLRAGEDCEVTGNRWQGGSSGIVAYGSGHTISGNLIEGTHSYALFIPYGSDWQNVPDPGLSFEALSNSTVQGNAIIDPRVRGLVYGAFRKEEPGNGHLTIPPHDNTLTGNVLIGQQGTLLIAEGFGNSRISDNLLHASGSAKAGNPVAGFEEVPMAEAKSALPTLKAVSEAGVSWLPVES
jgi:poly(beta-D-mannuronate) lyase